MTSRHPTVTNVGFNRDTTTRKQNYLYLVRHPGGRIPVPRYGRYQKQRGRNQYPRAFRRNYCRSAPVQMAGSADRGGAGKRAVCGYLFSWEGQLSGNTPCSSMMSWKSGTKKELPPDGSAHRTSFLNDHGNQLSLRAYAKPPSADRRSCGQRGGYFHELLGIRGSSPAHPARLCGRSCPKSV